MSNYTSYRVCHVRQTHIIIILRRAGPLVTNLRSGNPEMTNLRTDEMVFFRNFTKIGTDENKAIHSSSKIVLLQFSCLSHRIYII